MKSDFTKKLQLDNVAPLKKDIEACDSWPESVYLLQQKHRIALDAALKLGRPLLIRGECGIGKTELARAAAALLEFRFIPVVLKANTIDEELLYEFDSVERLAVAQLLGGNVAQLLGENRNSGLEHEKVREYLDKSKFIIPGPFWGAINYGEAFDFINQFTLKHKKPSWDVDSKPRAARALLLVDEIDKAPPNVPDFLLEVLANNGFHPNYPGSVKITCEPDARPLVIFTTNEDRRLSDSFLRRCLVLSMSFPEESDLVAMCCAHLGDHHWDNPKKKNELTELVQGFLQFRNSQAEDSSNYRPGISELLDLAKYRFYQNDSEPSQETMEMVKQITCSKGGQLI